MSRNIITVINSIIKEIPSNYSVHQLELVKNDASYRAPEDQLICWNNLQRTLIDLIPELHSDDEEWKFKVWSIFSTTPVEDIKLKIKLDEVK